MSQYIDSHEALIKLCKNLRNKEWIALDTEFIREKNYYPKLCLIQVATSDDILSCIDPLVIKDLTPFIHILKDHSITKVFHAAYQDLEIFYYLMGDVPAPIFDTQIAASVLGLGEQIGYARLVEILLHIYLEKSQSRTDWLHRPLNQKQIEYAINDVRYLQEIYPLIRQKLENKGRLDWLAADFQYLSDKKNYEIDLSTCWKRVKGKQTLKGIQLAILQELAAWRERVAIKKDRPRHWIVSDGILIDLARRQPKSRKQILQIRNSNDKHLRAYHQAWLKAIQIAKNTPKEQWPSLPVQQKVSPEQDILLDLLMLSVKYQAKKHQINTSILTNRKQVLKMLQANNNKFSNDWRGVLLNDIFADILSGKLKVMVRNGEVVLQN